VLAAGPEGARVRAPGGIDLGEVPGDSECSGGIVVRIALWIPAEMPPLESQRTMTAAGRFRACPRTAIFRNFTANFTLNFIESAYLGVPGKVRDKVWRWDSFYLTGDRQELDRG
jgi:hypothetical protein